MGLVIYGRVSCLIIQLALPSVLYKLVIYIEKVTTWSNYGVSNLIMESNMIL